MPDDVAQLNPPHALASTEAEDYQLRVSRSADDLSSMLIFEKKETGHYKRDWFTAFLHSKMAAPLFDSQLLLLAV